jgi:dipeptidyl aminopeptidase/acylaminoacyl peptidase
VSDSLTRYKDAVPLGNGSVFLSGSSFIDNSTYHLFEPHGQEPSSARVLSSNSRNGTNFGLWPGQVDEFWWEGALKNQRIHAWVIKPSVFNAKEKYPLAYVIHGGKSSFTSPTSLYIMCSSGI